MTTMLVDEKLFNLRTKIKCHFAHHPQFINLFSLAMIMTFFLCHSTNVASFYWFSVESAETYGKPSPGLMFHSDLFCNMVLDLDKIQYTTMAW